MGYVGGKMKTKNKKGKHSKEKQELKLYLVNCEDIQEADALRNNTSRIRCSASIAIKYPDVKPQVVNIHHTGTILKIT
mgnify:CR=1 FL=1